MQSGLTLTISAMKMQYVQSPDIHKEKHVYSGCNISITVIVNGH